MHANVVIAIGPEETLPAILSHIHGAGLGPNALVVRPRRSSIQHQLQRSGIPVDTMPPRVDAAPAVLVIHAAARAPLAADLTRRHGASATWIVAPDGTWNLVDDDIAVPAHFRPAAAPVPSVTPRPVVPTPTPASPDEFAET